MIGVEVGMIELNLKQIITPSVMYEAVSFVPLV